MESVHVVFDEPTHEERYHQDERHPLENDPEGSEERDMCALLHQGKHNGNHQCRNEVRQEGEGSHGIQVPSQFRRDNGCSCCTRSDDAAQDSLPHDLRMNIIGICRKQDDANDDQHEEYLKQRDPEMPWFQTHLMEIHLTERHEQNQEHEQRQDLIEDRLKEPARLLQFRCEGKEDIQQRSQSHGDR